MTIKPNKDADYLEDLRCLTRSVLDATNLINFQWFLYDEARRKAWLEHMKGPPNHQSESVPMAAGFKNRTRHWVFHELSETRSRPRLARSFFPTG